MKKATQRPTIQTRYNAQVKADRKAAALQRRLEAVNELDERRRMYANIGA